MGKLRRKQQKAIPQTHLLYGRGGRLGCVICYDWLFPEPLRQLAANGAEVLIRVSAYVDR